MAICEEIEVASETSADVAAFAEPLPDQGEVAAFVAAGEGRYAARFLARDYFNRVSLRAALKMDPHPALSLVRERG